VGWAALTCECAGEDERAHPLGLLGTGARVFEAGVQGTEMDIASGRDEPKGQQRRQARLARRGLERRGRRLMVLYLRLVDGGLLPSTETDPRGLSNREPRAAPRREARLAAARERDAALKALDAELWEQWRERLAPGAVPAEERHRLAQVLPYALRAHALDGKLDPLALGRALYHLGQRRGFLSNRKAPKKADEKPGAVEAGIGAIRQGMADTGSRTLGEYLFRCDPFSLRIRERYTARELYKAEFEAIWEAQAEHHPALLTDEARRRIERAIFDQRPLRNQKHLVGYCELEPRSRRAPIACAEFQRFRLLGQLNKTRLVSPDASVRRPFTPEERAALFAVLEAKGDQTFTAAKHVLKPFGVNRRWSFNFESGGEKRFVGNRTAARLRAVFGARWDELTARLQEDVVADLLSIQRPETLRRRGERVWGLQGEPLRDFAAIELEEGHAALSRRALRKLLPLLEQWDDAKGQWMDVTTAKERAGYRAPAREPLPLLPSLEAAVAARLLPAVRNPAVTRTLTELRKVVNALIQRHGRPAVIRVELGRDLRNPRDRRVRMAQEMRKREREREAAARTILKESGDAHPSRDDKEKVLLWEECNRECPYTGRPITLHALLGPTPHFDVEHIVPFSASLDDSFLNKTLCEASENRARKRNRTPWEAYHNDPQRWEDMLTRVKAFKGDGARAKLERFQLRDVSALLSEFTSRQLNDTRYASRLAREYLGLLYGGTTDADGTLRVQVAQGRITAYLRGALRLASILRDGGAEQKRDDHRHHAVDAVAVALTNPAVVKAMSDLAGARALEGRKGIGQLNAPWEGFLEEVRVGIEAAKVSHRPSLRVRGRLHEDTFYSPPRRGADGKEYVHVRKRVDAISKNDLEGIVDPHVREAVRAKLREIGSDDPKKLDVAANPPVLRTKAGGTVPIRKARVRRPAGVFAIGSGPHRRHVVSDANHHAEIVEVTDAKGRVKWEGHVVSLFEAYRRRRAKEPVVRRENGDGKRFLFSLAPTDTIELDKEDGQRAHYHVRSIWLESGALRMRYAPLNDARKAEEMKKAKASQVKMIEPLRKLGMRKVTITPLGEVRNAND
jgi:CRISPR-associated endonuclease Csn1